MPPGKGYKGQPRAEGPRGSKNQPALQPAKTIPNRPLPRAPKNQLQGKGLAGIKVTRVMTAQSGTLVKGVM